MLLVERRGRRSEVRTSRFIALLDTLPIRVDAATSQRALPEILPLTREQQRLSAYDDTAYLELAMREGVSLVGSPWKERFAALPMGPQSAIVASSAPHLI